MGDVSVNLANLHRSTGVGVVTSQKQENHTKEDNQQVKNGSIFAGNISNMTNESIEQKREMARKQASKLIMDQFAKDNELTDGMDLLRARNKEIREEITSLNEEKKYYQEQQEALKGKYGIAPDSEQQQELDLIRKAKNAIQNGNTASLSKDEWKQLANIGELTEYQRRSLEYDNVISIYDGEIRALEKECRENSSTIQGDKEVLLKTSYKGICAAKKGADAILEAASQEIQGMIWEEAKQHVEEEMEELVETAKEKAEEEEELEEKLEAAKEEKNGQEELTEQIQESTSQQDKLQGEIEKLLKEAELLREEMKGLVVDDIL